MKAAKLARALVSVALLAGIAAALYNARLPGSILTIAGGALFGPLAGTFYSLTGATLGATFAFLIARYVASGWVTQQTGARLAGFMKSVEAEGWRFVAFLRLVPLFPFNALNYALGLTRIPLRQYVVASYLAMVPGAAAYTYLGYAGREALGGSDALLRHALIALALIAATLFLPRLARRLRKANIARMVDVQALERRLAAGEPVTVVDVRGLDEYNGALGHIPGSLNIPLHELPNTMERLETARDGTIVLVCKTDKRSTHAAGLLGSAGFSRVEVLRGGMEQWSRRSLFADTPHGQDSPHPQ